ncbi:hypothetical protein SAMN05192533_102318 [Mesobacillus persicus]|uniref:Uncharacterized protein n=1 Tax=Mesobacillus persicus TaxID=930146 RepID=A0A1H7XQ77_9BACI|nr:hypothetical protein [Mesobacillus persicus]SEM35986.1 hypothetical protein SAMN05192533_102318 [Mesobacillus persicus]
MDKIDPTYTRQFIKEHTDGEESDYFLDQVFDEAIVGVVESPNKGFLVVYDYNHCVSIIESDNETFRDVSAENAEAASYFESTIYNKYSCPSNVVFWENSVLEL